ncbi:MAG: alpha/beta fold hydrolase [Chloroflexi bacterium]|nr:alpha/beta fold hydrolase [Chloroflexota bacterium]
MPYVDNNGVRIHYHIEGEGTPLVLQHGLTSSILRWYEFGFVDALKSDYRLLLVDARGHGDSDKPHDADAYNQTTMASDVVAAMDTEGIDKAHYIGYSMGGSIGFALAESFADRFHSLIIGGMHPYSLDAARLEDRIKRIKAGGMEGYVTDLAADGDVISPERKAQLLANDPEAIIGASLGLIQRPNMSPVLPTMTMPCLVYCGDADGLHVGAAECVKRMPNVTWVSLPGLDHTQAMERSELVLPHVQAFLKETGDGS